MVRLILCAEILSIQATISPFSVRFNHDGILPQQVRETGAGAAGTWSSDVRYLNPTPIEIINLTKNLDKDAPESGEFNEILATLVENRYTLFFNTTIPELLKLAPDNKLAEHAKFSPNDAFFNFQRGVFESGGGDSAYELASSPWEKNTGGKIGMNTTWKELEARDEYHRLRWYLAKLSRRFLARHVGMSPEEVEGLDFSIFNWFAVTSASAMHNYHTHMGEYVVGVYYVRTGEDAGSLVFRDPRGDVLPFGKEIHIQPKEGQIVLFPSWLAHMATTNGAGTSEKPRIIMAFNVGSTGGAVHPKHWYLDPTSKITLQKQDSISFAIDEVQKCHASGGNCADLATRALNGESSDTGGRAVLERKDSDKDLTKHKSGKFQEVAANRTSMLEASDDILIDAGIFDTSSQSAYGFAHHHSHLAEPTVINR